MSDTMFVCLVLSWYMVHGYSATQQLNYNVAVDGRAAKPY